MNVKTVHGPMKVEKSFKLFYLDVVVLVSIEFIYFSFIFLCFLNLDLFILKNLYNENKETNKTFVSSKYTQIKTANN